MNPDLEMETDALKRMQAYVSANPTPELIGWLVAQASIVGHIRGERIGSSRTARLLA